MEFALTRCRIVLNIGITALILFQFPAIYAEERVKPPSTEIVAKFKLSNHYTKSLLVDELPVLGSEKVSDFAILEAAYLIRHMIGHRLDILQAMANNNVRFVVMAATEMTTDVPEYSDLEPASYWNRRARGLGATEARPAVSCGEENLLNLPGDPYRQENILIHEFAHAIHERGMSSIDPTFDKRLAKAYENARTIGLWSGTYAMQNRMEYWAEATQSWFDTNRKNDQEHGPINTRDLLKLYDPEIAKLLEEVYGNSRWRYISPSARFEPERSHLAGLNQAKLSSFVWTKDISTLARSGEVVKLLQPGKMLVSSPHGSNKKTALNFMNHRDHDVSLFWIDFDGRRKFYATINPGLHYQQNTFSGHVWVITEYNKDIGLVIATESASRVEIE
ncbi:MAG: hypothetical protein QX198_13780 [Methylococcaceae bacterium]